MREPVTNLQDILDPVAIYHLVQRLQQRRNILITGGAGSGKTTVQRALGNMLGPNVRIGVAEDRPELALDDDGRNMIITRSRLENNNELEISDLIHNFLKMRVEWIFTGEIRNGEDADAFLAVANQGTGIIGDVHGPEAVDGIERLCSLGALYDKFDLAFMRAVSGINTIVHVERVPGAAWNARRMVSIYDVKRPNVRPQPQPLNYWSPSKPELETVYEDPRLRAY